MPPGSARSSSGAAAAASSTACRGHPVVHPARSVWGSLRARLVHRWMTRSSHFGNPFEGSPTSARHTPTPSSGSPSASAPPGSATDSQASAPSASATTPRSAPRRRVMPASTLGPEVMVPRRRPRPQRGIRGALQPGFPVASLQHQAPRASRAPDPGERLTADAPWQSACGMQNGIAPPATSRLLVAGVVVSALLAPQLARAEDLPLQEVIRLALARNERAQIARLTLVTADAAVTKARAAFLPSFNLGASEALNPYPYTCPRGASPRGTPRAARSRSASRSWWRRPGRSTRRPSTAARPRATARSTPAGSSPSRRPRPSSASSRSSACSPPPRAGSSARSRACARRAPAPPRSSPAATTSRAPRSSGPRRPRPWWRRKVALEQARINLEYLIDTPLPGRAARARGAPGAAARSTWRASPSQAHGQRPDLLAARESAAAAAKQAEEPWLRFVPTLRVAPVAEDRPEGLRRPVLGHRHPASSLLVDLGRRRAQRPTTRPAQAAADGIASLQAEGAQAQGLRRRAQRRGGAGRRALHAGGGAGGRGRRAQERRGDHRPLPAGAGQGHRAGGRQPVALQRGAEPGGRAARRCGRRSSTSAPRSASSRSKE